MKLTRLILALALALVGCQTATAPADALDATTPLVSEAGGGVDATVAEGGITPTADAAIDAGVDAAKGPMDAAVDAVAGDGGACVVDTDCRKFASYCDGTVLRPCQCVALRAGDPDPKCDGTTVACILDPCMGKTAKCTLGACVIP